VYSDGKSATPLLRKNLCNSMIMTRFILGGRTESANNANACLHQLPIHCSFAYSDFASFRMGMSGSASFQRVKKS